MGKTYTDFSQLSKGMFRKSDPVVEIKPLPEAGNGKRGTGNGESGGCGRSWGFLCRVGQRAHSGA